MSDAVAETPASADDRRILRVLSVVGEPILQTDLRRILDILGWRDVGGRPLSQGIAASWRKKAIAAGQVVEHRNSLACHPELLEILTRETLADGSFARIADAAERVSPTKGRYSSSVYTQERRFRLLRLALYGGDEPRALELLDIAPAALASQVSFAQVEPLARICTTPPDPGWLLSLAPRLRILALVPPIREATLELVERTDLHDIAERVLSPLAASHPDAGNALAEQALLRGRLGDAAARLEGREDPEALGLRGWLACLRGDWVSGLARFEDALRALRRATRKRKLMLPGLPGVFHLAALIQRGERADLEQALELIAGRTRGSGTSVVDLIVWILGDLIEALAGRASPGDGVALQHPMMPHAMPLLFQSLALHWLGQKPRLEAQRALAGHARQARKSGLLWYAGEAEALRLAGNFAEGPAAADPVPAGQDPFAEVPSESPPTARLTRLVAPRASWEIALDALKGIGEQPAQPADGGADRRLVWLLTDLEQGGMLEPREQSRAKKGGWTSGRAVSLQRLAEEPGDFPWLTPKDHDLRAVILREIQESGWYGGYQRTVYRLDQDRALLAAAGHPLVFRSEGGATLVPVELVRARPTLNVVRQGQNIQVGIEPFPPRGRSVLAVAETPQRIRLIQFDNAHREIARVLGPDGLRVPRVAEARLLEGIAAVAPMLTVHSEIGGGEDLAETVPADARPHVHLTPIDGGLNLELLIQPFGETGPRFRPGQGGATLFVEQEGRTRRCVRDLARERAAAQAVLAACPTLAGVTDWFWSLDDLELALSALEQLHALGDAVVLNWPRGRRIGLTPETQVSQVRVSIERQADWLGLQGELRLDDGRVLRMSELLELAAAARGRFVKLGEDQYLTLSQALRRRLDSLRGLADEGRFHPLAAPAVAEAIEGMSVKAGKPWRELLDRLETLRTLEPEVPSTLQAELRDYQIEGYRWLARLAHWGAGACLADDMGLGKTVQALALILARAPGGPTLVVAPTSVCGNWIDEARRFAPTLRPRRFGPGDRAAMLKDAGPFDLVLCSYGLLQSEGERLAEVSWETIVADEAQAFKNALTKRSKAIMRLRGGFRMITTGTPVENRLEELWNLFRFVNPGLLGSQERFGRRFAAPIEQHRDSGARQRLRQLIRPFILRRLKSEVLHELPPRTEITLRLELSEGEQALYEALRRQALERLAAAGTDAAGAGHRRLQLLAEIMRLRRACCHPRLALPDSDLPAAKLEAFGEILDELLDSGHKALVFSQFVDHLALIRAELERRGVRHQYLDGSTPEPARRAAVAAFQAGEGEVFLISLRAGGVGLNLTAADYVIHMDPWWNPAVEDQASDRAHRIGQERPVTVYRLVARGTIEERILDLHASKRDLADGLLEGTADGGRLSYEDMLNLVRGAADD